MEEMDLPLEQTNEVSLAEMDALVSALFAKKQEIEEAEAVVSELNKALMQIQMKLTDALKAHGRESYSHPAGRINIIQQWRYKMPQSYDGKDKLYNWLKSKGDYEGLITINANTFNAYCKREEEAHVSSGKEGLFEIPGVEPPSLFETVRVTKARS